MSSGVPLWRRTFDKAERTVGKPLEQVASSRHTAQLFTVGFRIEGAAKGLLERQTRILLHFWNLPAHSDVARLNRQVAMLVGEVHALSARLEEERGRGA